MMYEALDEIFEFADAFPTLRGSAVKMAGRKSMIREGTAGAARGGGGLYVQPAAYHRERGEMLKKHGLKPGEVHIAKSLKGTERRDTLAHELGHRKNARALQRAMGPRKYRKLARAAGMGFVGSSLLGLPATAAVAAGGSKKQSAAAAGVATAALAPRLIDEAVATGRVVKRNRKRGISTSKAFLAKNIGSYGALAAAPWVARSLINRVKV